MKIIAICALAAASLVATAATAQPERTDVKVSFADLNLASPAGHAALVRRITVAANTACGVDANRWDLLIRRKAVRCRDAAVANALAQVDAVATTQIALR